MLREARRRVGRAHVTLLMLERPSTLLHEILTDERQRTNEYPDVPADTVMSRAALRPTTTVPPTRRRSLGSRRSDSSANITTVAMTYLVSGSQK